MLLFLFAAMCPLLIRQMYARTYGLDKLETEDRGKLVRYMIFAALPMFLMLACRSYKMGNDTGTYVYMFYELRGIPFSKILSGDLRFGLARLETGFLLFVKVVGLITDSGLMYQFIYVGVYMVSVLFFAYHEKNDPFLFLYFFATLGTYMFFYTGVRQCLAMSICLFAYHFARNRKWVWFGLLVWLAYYFHKSAAFFFPVALIMNRKVKGINILLYIIAAVIMAFSLESIVGVLNDALGYTTGVVNVGNGIISFFVMLAIGVFGIAYFFMNTDCSNIAQQRTINVSVLCVGMWFARVFSRTAERPAYYFSFFLCSMLASTVQSMGKEKNKAGWILLILALCLAFYLYKFTNVFAGFIPYSYYIEVR